MNENISQPVKKRRIRYKGTHPRHFEEKYKELQAEKYASDIAKVIDRGQTPAGTHRPICVNEIISVLDIKSGMIGLDATLGFGGHTQELIPKILPGGHLFGIDVDPIELPKTECRLRNLGFTEDVLTIRRMNFAGLPQLIPLTGKFDFILADLGVSSMQIDNPSRGFSFKTNGPLDLRMNPSKGRSAYEVIQIISVDELTDILIQNADEPNAELIAKTIINHKKDISTTTKLSVLLRESLEKTFPKLTIQEINKSIQRVFQALRIFVNDEFTVLDQFLTLLPDCIKENGHIAILTFHSGEDRRVKKAFQKGFRTGIYKQIARNPIRPSPMEQNSNPRSSCAKLRWAIKA